MPSGSPTHQYSATGLPPEFFRHASPPRIDNYLTGGSKHFRTDRRLAGLLVAKSPWLPHMLKINQRHRPRAVAVLAYDLGITQFLDLGCGLPSNWNRKLQRHEPALTYEAARAVHSDARVVYIDNDPVVCAHARATLDVNGATAAVQADVRKIDELLGHPDLKLLDRDQPVAVLAHDLLPWLNTNAAAQATAALYDWLPAGSALSITHSTLDLAPDAMRVLCAGYADAGIAYQPRSLAQIQALLAPWAPLSREIVPTGQWPADNVRHTPSRERSNAYAAIVTKAPSTQTAARQPEATRQTC
ncbi:SAM-dependent methyltransferase [Streptomyces europaeiscabiei]|nr:SAM-dependent methyltransferase [Streptomyces europaeiscabiei]MDX3694812.1 SAM-dependent methyltransferase [Streptomyces europaeiscabiei]